MRYLAGSIGRETVVRKLVLAMVLAGLAGLPLSVGAQATDKERLEDFYPGSLPESPQEFDEDRLDDFYPESARPSQPAPEEPALQLQLDETGVGVVPSPPQTFDGYTLEEMDVRVRRAEIGLGVSVVAFIGGVVMASAGGVASVCLWSPCSPPGWAAPVGITGAVLIVGGIVGIGVSGRKLRRRKRDRDSLRAAHYGKPRRVQWDLAQSRLVF